MKQVYALVDCNSFYASCEKVFRPDLEKKPVVVLSNNDGCIIARSPEAKNIGLKMGQPIFQVGDLVKKEEVQIFSANFTLYGSISNRVMNILEKFTSELEVYSIDEAFLLLEKDNLTEVGERIKSTITKGIGIPVCVGFGETKTLAKMANHIAKTHPEFRGICDLSNSKKAKDIMHKLPVNVIWGVGAMHAKMLNWHKIYTVKDFVNTPSGFIQKQMTIMGRRTQEELMGIHRIDLEEIIPAKKAICTSRSFGKNLMNYNEVEEALCTFVANAAAKLRKQKSNTALLTVFIMTNPFKDGKQYNNSLSIKIPQPTNSTIILAQYARFVLKKIFKEGYIYKKCGVILDDFKNQEQIQLPILNKFDVGKHTALMKAIDKITHKHGQRTIRLASEGIKEPFKMRQQRKSPYYTTSIKDIFKVKSK